MYQLIRIDHKGETAWYLELRIRSPVQRTLRRIFLREATYLVADRKPNKKKEGNRRSKKKHRMPPKVIFRKENDHGQSNNGLRMPAKKKKTTAWKI